MIKWVGSRIKEEDPDQETAGPTKHEEEEFIRKCALDLDAHFIEQRQAFFTKCLYKLGLQEIQLKDGQKMIQPIQHKDTKLGKQDISRLVGRLYPQQKCRKNNFRHLNKIGISEIKAENYIKMQSKHRWSESLWQSDKYNRERQKEEDRKTYGKQVWKHNKKK